MKICIITARKNSQRIPGKNLKRLGNKFLIAWTIEAAIEVVDFDEIRIVTDDDDLRQYVEDTYWENCICLREPDELGADNKHIDAILWSLEGTHSQTDICLLQPTAPFRTWLDIKYFFSIYRPPYNLAAVSPEWKACGAIYIIKYGALKNHKSFHTPLTHYIPLPYPNCLDIDTMDDWLKAEEVVMRINAGMVKQWGM